MKKSLLKLALGIVTLSTGLNSFAQTIYTFSNATATGNEGPTQAMVDAAYSGTNLNGNVEVINGIQYWVVPTSGTYHIDAYGGQGYGDFGGRGAKMTGDFSLVAGDTLKILVGQKAGDYLDFPAETYNHQFGGGGGSFITQMDNTPLIVAGGGGGSHDSTSFITSADGQITTAGSAGSNASTIGTGGTSGNGGLQAASADGGGGLIGNGTGNGAAGQSFINGGLGGIDEGTGGFGCGGGTSSFNNYRCGGGGGYSGGGGANNNKNCCPVGGGGGSFNSGINQNNIAGIQLGNGSIIIDLCATTVAPTITSTCPINITVDNDPGICGAIVNYTAPTAADDCRIVTGILTTGFASGATFPIGTTNVTYDMTNAIGTVSCSFTVTVVDAENPTITCPSDTTINTDLGQCSYTSAIGTATGTDNCSTPTITNDAPVSFPVGNTTVTWTSTDAANNSITCTQIVTVIDTATIPTITCLNDLTICETIVTGIAPEKCSGEVTYILSGVTTGSGSDDASGTEFNVGVTTVSYYITGITGLKDSCKFDVTVLPQSTVSINSFSPDTVCHGANPIALPSATPTGGTYSGSGVVGTTFEPGIAGAGSHSVTYSFTDGNSCVVSAITNIVVENCVGIDENASLNNVNIYPNPTNGLVHINLGHHNGSINYTISTIEGRIVNQVNNIFTNEIAIDLNNESNGIYLLRIEDTTSSKVYKLIKE